MNRNLQIAVLLINTFVLALEIAITRIFSVTMFYHFAFLAIGVALFGFGASGVVLYIWKKAFSGGSIGRRLGNYAMWAGITTLIAIYIALAIRFDPQGRLGGIQFVKLLAIYLSMSVPFFFAGLALAQIFQEFSKHIPRLYLLSLVGSALGALISIPLLQFAGGPGAVVVIVGLAFFSMYAFYGVGSAEPGKQSAGRLVAGVIAVLFVILGFLNPEIGLVKLNYAKGTKVLYETLVYDKWNAFSQITVSRADNPLVYYPNERGEIGDIQKFGISPEWDLDVHPFPEQLFLKIDATAGTPITRFDGDVSALEIAKYDVTAVAHYLLDKPKVLVVGPGGGKDLLAALAFGASDIDGVEINPLIDDVMRDVFRDFNGNLYDYDPIHVTIGEGRTFIARSRPGFYDMIQISLIDTWAAASTGAYALSENNLYTVEAFDAYYDHLAPGGVFSMSRFEFDNPPRETLKVVTIASAALRERGADPSNCILVVRMGSIANVMVRPDGFSEAAVDTMQDTVDRLDFRVIYLPGMAPPSPEEPRYQYYKLLTTDDFDGFINSYPLDIRPTTDDRPFFFYLLRPNEFLGALKFAKTDKEFGYNSIAIFTLVALLIISFAVVLIFIVLPLLLFRRKDIVERSSPKLTLLGYFICLGLAYILVEIALMQHFTLFLGYPIYSLVAVLMSLLLFSGFGAGWSGRISEHGLETGIRNAILGIIITAVVYIFVLPPIFSALITLPDFVRIIMTIFLVFPLGWFMGQPFPLGLRIIEREGLGVIPWAWGVNGAASVLGSALALTLAIGIGYRLTLFAGVAVYLIAWLVVIVIRKNGKTG